MTMQDGVSRWRQVGDQLIREIEQGVFDTDARLPKAQELAVRFGVNRHTVLRALAHLQDKGFVRVERGRGVQMRVNPIQYRMGAQQWFERNLLELNRTPSRTVLSVVEVPADEALAQALDIPFAAPVVRVAMLGGADGTPINYNHHFFPAQRLPGIAECFRAFGTEPTTELSFAAIFRQFGVTDWRRRMIRIRARPPRDDEIRHLVMSPSDHVLETEVTSVDHAGRPLVHATTSFASSRVELTFEVPAESGQS